MGGPWMIPTDNPLIIVHDWGCMIAVAYGEADWPSQSYSLWIWDAE